MWTCQQCGEQLDEIQRICWTCGGERERGDDQPAAPAAPGVTGPTPAAATAKRTAPPPPRSPAAQRTRAPDPVIHDNQPSQSAFCLHDWRAARWGLLLIHVGAVLATLAWVGLQVATTVADLYSEVDLQEALIELEVKPSDAEFASETLYGAQGETAEFCFNAIKVFGAVILLGLLLCCKVPAESKVREVVIAATGLVVLALLIRLTFDGEVSVPLWAIVDICSLIAGCALFLVFLHGVARFLGDKELARRTARLIAFAVGMGVMVLIVIPSMSRPDENYYRGILVFAVDGVAAAIGVVWCLRLIGSTRKAIRNGPRSEAETTADDGG